MSRADNDANANRSFAAVEWHYSDRRLNPTTFAALKRANESGWVAYNDAGRRHVVHDDGPCAYHAAVSDGHAGKNDGAASNPHIVADADRPGIFQTGSPHLRFERMRRGVHLHRRSHLKVVPDLDQRAIEKNAIEIDEGMYPQPNVIAIITGEERPDDRAVPDRTEQPA